MRFCLLLFMAFCASWGNAQDFSLFRAREFGAYAKEILRIVDDMGNPVPGAHVWGGLQTGDHLNDYSVIDGYSDANGVYVIKGKCTNRIRCDIRKKGFYRSEFLLKNYGCSHVVNNGKWEPYGNVTVVVLRRIDRLGEMFVPNGSGAGVGRWSIPVREAWTGFDLEKFDWVTPYGSGVYEDVLLKFSTAINNEYKDFRLEMEVCFTNNPFAGAYVCKKGAYSDFPWPRCADSNACYVAQLKYVNERRPDGTHVSNVLSKDECLIFRTRTTVDRKGNLLSAHYGVISGEWSLGSETIRVGDACFNNKENDVCIEDGYYLRKAVKEDSQRGK